MIVDDRITAFINSMEQALPSPLRELEKTALNESVPIIRKETQSLLRFLISLQKPKKILEVGAAVGFSALYMSEYMPDTCSITTIEKVPARIEKAKFNFKHAKRQDKIQLLEGDALVILEQLAKTKPGQYDFIFMDAAKGQYMNFLPEILKLLPVGGILITDNVLQDGAVAQSRFSITRRDRTIHTRMREYLYTLTHIDDLVTCVLPVGDGVTVSTKVSK